MARTQRGLPDAPQSKRVLDLDEIGLSLKTEDLIRRFRSSNMTIFTWRTQKGLPFWEIPTASGTKSPVRFSEEEVQAWADKHGIRFYTEEEMDLMEQQESQVV